jgi:hypothetical protein
MHCRIGGVKMINKVSGFFHRILNFEDLKVIYFPKSSEPLNSIITCYCTPVSGFLNQFGHNALGW